VIPTRVPGRPVIGVLGGGQLGRMLGLAGLSLGARFVFLDPDPNAPAGEVGELITAPYDVASLGALAERCDVVTWEFENVPDAAARWLADRVRVAPPPMALERTQDRLVEKSYVRSQGLPTALHARVGAVDDLHEALALTGIPAILKTRRLGYDGRGQARIERIDEGPDAWDAIGRQPAIVEGVVPFTHEWAVLAVRAADGEVRTWTLTRTVHVDGILVEAVADPLLVPVTLAEQAVHVARAVLGGLNYVGVAGIECFEVDGRLLVNEVAPRVHNSGHWTIEGSETSQFENHLRAVLDLPLGGTGARGVSHLLNVIGELPDPAEILAVPGAHLHLYAKQARPGRKLGHVTVRADDASTVAAAVPSVRAALQAPAVAAAS
jgi:5-(carboxyamino)imidazole ribonucleotide synthase